MAKEEIYAYSMDIVNERKSNNNQSLVAFHLVTDFYSLTDMQSTYAVWCVVPHQMNQTKRVVPRLYTANDIAIGTKTLGTRNRRREEAKTNYKCPMNFIQKAHAANTINNRKRRMNRMSLPYHCAAWPRDTFDTI